MDRTRLKIDLGIKRNLILWLDLPNKHNHRAKMKILQPSYDFERITSLKLRLEARLSGKALFREK